MPLQDANPTPSFGGFGLRLVLIVVAKPKLGSHRSIGVEREPVLQGPTHSGRGMAGKRAIHHEQVVVINQGYRPVPAPFPQEGR